MQIYNKDGQLIVDLDNNFFNTTQEEIDSIMGYGFKFYDKDGNVVQLNKSEVN